MHLRIANQVMPVRINEHSADVLRANLTTFSRGLTHGEAGILRTHDEVRYVDDHMIGPNLRIHTVRFRITEDGEHDVISGDTDSVACLPDECDVSDGIASPVAYAAHHIRERMRIWGPNAASNYPASWSPGVWFSGEVYQHPYEDYYEETTVHPAGFTPEEGAELVTLVTAPWEV